MFYIWVCLDTDKDLKEQENDFINLLKKEVKVLNYHTDNESIMTIEVEITTLTELLHIGQVLEDDILIYGSEQDIIIAKYDLAELGLN